MYFKGCACWLKYKCGDEKPATLEIPHPWQFKRVPTYPLPPKIPSEIIELAFALMCTDIPDVDHVHFLEKYYATSQFIQEAGRARYGPAAI
jgi:hypothetical protein